MRPRASRRQKLISSHPIPLDDFLTFVLPPDALTNVGSDNRVIFALWYERIGFRRDALEKKQQQLDEEEMQRQHQEEVEGIYDFGRSRTLDMLWA